MAEIDTFVREHDLMSYREVLCKGGLVANAEDTPGGFELIEELTEADKAVLRFEQSAKWKSSPWMLYALCGLCAGCAVVQGMDQTVINGAQVRSSRLELTTRPPTNGDAGILLCLFWS